MKYKRRFTVLTVLFISLELIAQYLPDMTLSKDYAAQVKSLEEFMNRFNGTESKPGLELREHSRQENIVSLFDFDIDRGKLSEQEFGDKINDFVDSVIVSGCKFGITDSRLFAKCRCKTTYKGKEMFITLYLRSESYVNGTVRWAIAGVDGLSDIISYDKYYSVSPVQHEVHFIELQDKLNENRKNAFGYRFKGASVDPLSVFFTLIYTGMISFGYVEEQTFLYYDIPGYVITISEISRSGNNSGWLITSFDRLSEEEKEKQINRIFNHE